jgi:signal transduction histidine kinase
LKTAFGDWKWVRTIGKVVEWDDEGEPIRAVGIHIDIDERKGRKLELQREKERLDEFASMVSHDLRNPLNIAQGRIDLARKEWDTEHLDAAADGIQRGFDLIEDLLALAKAGQEVGDLQPVDLPDVVDACWDTIETGDATVVADLGLTIRADRARLRQLIENLFRNAIEHGSEDVTVRIGSLPKGFYVVDDGPGISVAERENVWEAGYSGAEEGTGLGLFIVHQIVEAHDWNIRITEGSEGGARFELTGVDIVAE